MAKKQNLWPSSCWINLALRTLKRVSRNLENRLRNMKRKEETQQFWSKLGSRKTKPKGMKSMTNWRKRRSRTYRKSSTTSKKRSKQKKLSMIAWASSKWMRTSKAPQNKDSEKKSTIFTIHLKMSLKKWIQISRITTWLIKMKSWVSLKNSATQWKKSLVSSNMPTISQ